LGDTGILGKVIIMYAIVGTVFMFVPGMKFSGWSDFSDSITNDPFSGSPTWPTFGGPVVNVTVSDVLWFGGTDTDDSCNGGDKLLRDTIGSGGGTQSEFVGPLPRSHCWFLEFTNTVSYISDVWSVSLDLTESGAGTDNVYAVTIYRVTGTIPYPICLWPGETTVAFNVTLSCAADGVTFVTGDKLQIGVSKTAGTKAMFINFNGALANNADSFINPPSGSAGEENCGWENVGACISGTFDWLGRSVLYIGGVLWVVVSYVGLAITWFLGVVVSFFSLLLGAALLSFENDNGVPIVFSSDVRTVLNGVSVVLWGIILFSLFRLIRGAGD